MSKPYTDNNKQCCNCHGKNITFVEIVNCSCQCGAVAHFKKTCNDCGCSTIIHRHYVDTGIKGLDGKYIQLLPSNDGVGG